VTLAAQAGYMAIGKFGIGHAVAMADA